MPGVAGRSRFASFPGMLAGLCFLGTAWAQPGTVLSGQKVSDLEGNFTAIIDDLDETHGALAGLGDLDGPGPAASAIAIGAAHDDDGGADRGAVYIAFLATNGTVLSHQKISETVNFPGTPLDNWDQFGSAVAFLGDLDGAGPSVGALAVGSVGDDDGVSQAGAVYILFLSASGTVLSWQKISDTVNLPGAPLDSEDEFGGALAGLGDLDGSGPSTHAIAVGTTADDDGGGDLGAIYILFLSSSGTVLSTQKVSDTVNFPGAPLDPADDFGASMTSLGDLDGDGPAVVALAVGAAADDDGGTDRGAVYVLFLDASGTVLSTQKISDTQGNFTAAFTSYDEFGGALTHLGDIDGAAGGVTALAVGTVGDDDGGADRGAVQILFLNRDGTCAGYQKISALFGNLPMPLDNLDGFGSSLAFLGDLDGAGPSMTAVAVGAAGDDDGGIDRGGGYILFLDGVSVVGVTPFPRAASGNLLGRAWPNPFRPTTTIAFRLVEEADARIDIWDLSGRLVRQLVQARTHAGEHRAVWDGRDDAGQTLPNGTYFYRMTIDGRPVAGAGKALLLR